MLAVDLLLADAELAVLQPFRNLRAKHPEVIVGIQRTLFPLLLCRNFQCRQACLRDFINARQQAALFVVRHQKGKLHAPIHQKLDAVVCTVGFHHSPSPLFLLAA